MTRCIFHDDARVGTPAWIADVKQHGHTVSIETESAISEEESAAWVERNFDRNPDGSLSAPRRDPRIADRIRRMAAGYFG